MIKKMKHYIDILVFLFHKFYWDIMAHFGRVHGIVLMYHYITDEHVNTLPSCHHSPIIFENTMKRLKSIGYEFVSVEEMLEIVKKKTSKRFVVVTFDDIMDDVYTNAYPILKRLNIPFTLFVASGLIGTKDYVTVEHLKEMVTDTLCTIGSHTVTHCHLSKVGYSMEELIDSKKELSELLGRDVDYLAYPYGWHCDVSRRVMRQAKEAGYKCAFGTIQSPVSETSSKNLFYLPRIVLMR